MKFKKEKSRNYYLNETPIPNLFLGEYMLRMPGDVVRVYLYAYMRMMAGDPPADEAAIARELGIRTADVLDAWDYLEKKRLIRRRVTARDPGSYTIEFIDLKSRLFVAGAEPESVPVALEEKDVRQMYVRIEKSLGRPLGAADYKKAAELLEAYNLPADVVGYAYASVAAQDRPFNINAVRDLLTVFARQDVRTEEEAEECAAQLDARRGWHTQIKKALGISGLLTDEERRIFDSWIDDYGLTVEDILHKAKKTAGKNNKLAYLRSILDSDAEKAGIKKPAKASGKPSRKKFYEDRRRAAEDAAELRRKEVYRKNPAVKQIDDDIVRLSRELSLARVSGAENQKTVVRDITRSLKELGTQRETAMKASGFAPDYTDIVYACALCRDTGVQENGNTCSCFEF